MILKLGMQHRGLEPYKVYKRVDLDLFYGKVKFGIFSIGKVKKQWIFQKLLQPVT